MNQSVSAVPNYGFIAVQFAAFLWGTTGTVASFAPNLSPLAIGAAAMGGGGLLQALLARKSIIYHLVHVKANAVMLGVGVIAVFTFDDMADEFRIGSDGRCATFSRGITCCSNHGAFVPKSTNVGYCFRGGCGIDLCFIFLGGKTND